MYHDLADSLNDAEAEQLVIAHAHGAFLIRKGFGTDCDYILTINWFELST